MPEGRAGRLTAPGGESWKVTLSEGEELRSKWHLRTTESH